MCVCDTTYCTIQFLPSNKIVLHDNILVYRNMYRLIGRIFCISVSVLLLPIQQIEHDRNNYVTCGLIDVYNMSKKKSLLWNYITVVKGLATKVSKQLSFKQATGKTRKWDINDSQAQVIHRRMGEVIVLYSHSFLYAEFVCLLRALEPRYRYTVPSRKYITETVSRVNLSITLSFIQYLHITYCSLSL